jgi:Flagellar hook-length control protein FliK
LFYSMSLNFMPTEFAPLVSPALSSRETGFSATANAMKSAGERKNFSSVLRTIREDSAKDQAKQADNSQLKSASGADRRDDCTSRCEGSDSKKQDSTTEVYVTSGEPVQDSRKGDAADTASKPEASLETTSVATTSLNAASQGLLAGLIPSQDQHGEATEPMGVESIGPDDASLVATEQYGADASASMPMLMTALAAASVTTTVPEHRASPKPEETAKTLGQDMKQVLSTPLLPEKTPIHAPVPDDPEVAVTLDRERSTKAELRTEAHPIVSQQEPSQPIQQTASIPLQGAVLVEQGLSQKNGENQWLAADSNQTVSELQAERSAPAIPQATHPAPTHHDETDSKATSAVPHSWHTFTESGSQSDMQWTGQQNREQTHEELSTSQHQALPTVQSNSIAGSFNDVLTVGAGVNAVARPGEPSSAPVIAPAHAMGAMHETPESPLPAMTRSVVFQVAQPDLGQINIRVAMAANEMVHTYLSSDRPEVGQFLLNGQDRLQAAFQANGLDMGQFRVDIDRQHGGRWSEQGYPQEQRQGWSQSGSGSERGSRFVEPEDNRDARAYGTLNLVA